MTMEPTHETVTPNPELPSPVGELDHQSPHEARVPVQEVQPAPATPQGSVVASDPQAVIPSQGPAATPAQPVVANDDDTPIADDADLIEKEWIVRAKSLVEQTKDDPYLQNKEINKVKADYIKKRYNKDVKVSED